MSTHSAAPSAFSPRPTRRPIRRRATLRTATLYLAVAIACLISMAPIWFVLRTSVTSYHAYLRGEQDVSLEAWTQVLTRMDVGRQLANSVLVTAVSIALIVVISGLAGYGFSRLLSGRRPAFAFSVVVVGFMVPVQSIVAPMFFQAADLGLVGSFGGAILIYVCIGLPLSTFLMTAYFRAIPGEIFEAALLDGVGYLSMVWRILLPMSATVIVTVGLLQFVAIWNDLLIALLWLPTTDMRLLTVGLATVQTAGGSNAVSIPTIMAGAIVQSLPAVVLFAVFQKFIIRGINAGAVG